MNFELRTPNSELKTIFRRRHSLDDVLLQVQTSSPQKILFWGDGAGGISSYVAGWMAGKEIDVILLDGANCFNPYMVSSFARSVLIPPERLLKKIRIARAFTCYQMATLVERLAFLLHSEEAIQPESLPSPRRHLRKQCVILLGPITTFLDEDVPEGEVGPLFERSLKKMEIMAGAGIPFFLFQSHTFSKNPPFPPFAKNPPFPPLAKGGRGDLRGSKRAYLMRRLFQFSNLVWKISLETEGPKLILEKGLTENVGDQGLEVNWKVPIPSTKLPAGRQVIKQ